MAMVTLQALSKQLQINGINHIYVVVAGRPTASVYGREQFQKLSVKVNAAGQAGEIWLNFLRSFGIRTVPTALDPVNGGVFRYQYSNPKHSICIWTVSRPDQNPLRPGYAGTVVVRCDDNAPYAFGKVRSALVRISNIAPKYVRMTKQETMKLAEQLQGQADPVQVNDLTEHSRTLTELEDSRFSSLEDFGTKYHVTKKLKTKEV